MQNFVTFLSRIFCVRLWQQAGLHDSQPGKEVASTSDSNIFSLLLQILCICICNGICDSTCIFTYICFRACICISDSNLFSPIHPLQILHNLDKDKDEID